jgi:hypothetical protein
MAATGELLCFTSYSADPLVYNKTKCEVLMYNIQYGVRNAPTKKHRLADSVMGPRQADNYLRRRSIRESAESNANSLREGKKKLTLENFSKSLLTVPAGKRSYKKHNETNVQEFESEEEDDYGEERKEKLEGWRVETNAADVVIALANTSDAGTAEAKSGDGDVARVNAANAVMTASNGADADAARVNLGGKYGCVCVHECLCAQV